MDNKFFLSSALLLCGALFLVSCKKNDTATPYTNYGQYVFAGAGTAAQLVPANANDSSTATVNFNGVYDSTLQIFNYSFIWNGLTSKVTSLNFYAASDSGQVAPLARNIATYTSTNYLPSSDTVSFAIWAYSRLSKTEFNALKNNKWYYVINTQNFPAGEVRGQIKLVSTFK